MTSAYCTSLLAHSGSLHYQQNITMCHIRVQQHRKIPPLNILQYQINVRSLQLTKRLTGN